MKINTRMGIMVAVALFALTAILIITPGCADTQVTTDPATGQLVTNAVPNHYATQGAQTINVVAPLLPAPWNGVAMAVSALLTAISGIIARVERSRRLQHQTILRTIVAGVEQGNSDATKQAIHTLATVAGVNEKLDPIVQEISELLPKKTP